MTDQGFTTIKHKRNNRNNGNNSNNRNNRNNSSSDISSSMHSSMPSSMPSSDTVVEKPVYNIYDTGTSQCKYHIKNCCKYGKECEYSHPEDITCPKFQNGTCLNGNQCSLKHPINFCKFYFRLRKCSRGNACKFSHNEVNIRKFKNYKRSKACKFVNETEENVWTNNCRVNHCLYSHPSKDTSPDRLDTECKFGVYCFWYIVNNLNNCPYNHADVDDNDVDDNDVDDNAVDDNDVDDNAVDVPHSGSVTA
jgi:hypothetical protein